MKKIKWILPDYNLLFQARDMSLELNVGSGHTVDGWSMTDARVE